MNYTSKNTFAFLFQRLLKIIEKYNYIFHEYANANNNRNKIRSIIYYYYGFRGDVFMLTNDSLTTRKTIVKEM